MKETPRDREIHEQMQPGRISREGFLDGDTRRLGEILAEDENTVHFLGLTHAEIAERMSQLTEAGQAGLGTAVTVGGQFEVRVDEVRGELPCPWGHVGLYPKVNVHLKNIRTGETLFWTALLVHLIGEHGFYEGRDCRYRLDPARAARVLGLIQ